MAMAMPSGSTAMAATMTVHRLAIPSCTHSTSSSVAHLRLGFQPSNSAVIGEFGDPRAPRETCFKCTAKFQQFSQDAGAVDAEGSLLQDGEAFVEVEDEAEQILPQELKNAVIQAGDLAVFAINSGGGRERKAADWKKAEKVMESGAIHRGRVDACNSGGLLVRFGSLQGFLPFSQMDIARIPKDGSRALAEAAKELVGDLVSVKIIEVNDAERRLILSEKQAVLEESMRTVEEGSVYDGKVNSVTDFGAFVDLILPDGTSSVSGLVHISELSWDPVRNPRDLLQEGQTVRVKVIQLDRERMRLALSIKQLEADPLLETLDTLMPVESQDTVVPIDQYAELLGTSLPGLEQICDELLQEEGIMGVTLGRTRLEKRVVSQDLELWLSNAPVEDCKFSLLARAGRQVQEVQLNTSLDREGIKAAVQRVTGRVP